MAPNPNKAPQILEMIEAQQSKATRVTDQVPGPSRNQVLGYQEPVTTSEQVPRTANNLVSHLVNQVQSYEMPRHNVPASYQASNQDHSHEVSGPTEELAPPIYQVPVSSPDIFAELESLPDYEPTPTAFSFELAPGSLEIPKRKLSTEVVTRDPLVATTYGDHQLVPCFFSSGIQVPEKGFLVQILEIDAKSKDEDVTMKLSDSFFYVSATLAEPYRFHIG